MSIDDTSDDRCGSADAYLVQDADGTFISIDAPGGVLYGWKVADFIGTAAPMMVHPDDREVSWKVRELVRTSGVPQSVQLRVRTFGGRWLWTECSYVAIDDDEGRPGRLTRALIRDVSSRYLRDEALELLVEVRHVMDATDRIEAALTQALTHLVEWGGFRSAAAWHESDGEWAVWVTASGSDGDLMSCWSPERCDAVEAAAASGTWAWVDVARVGSSVTASGARRLIVPLLAAGTTVAVIELTGGTAVAGDTQAQLVIDIAQQLGDAIRRRRIESELAVARGHFEAAFSEAAIGMALIDMSGRFVDVNASLCELLGRDREEFASIGFEEVAYPDDIESDHRLAREMLLGERHSYHTEKRYLRSDGSVLWGSLSASLVRDPDGAPLHFICQIQDISDRKRAESELERSVARFRAAFDESPLGMALVRVDSGQMGSVVDANRRLEALTAALGRRVPLRYLSDLWGQQGDELLARLRDSGDTPLTYESRLVGADGERWVRAVASPVRGVSSEGGQFAIVQIEDVTVQRTAQEELADSERRYRSLVEPSVDFIMRLTVDGRVEAVNQRAAGSIGAAPEDLIGRRIDELVPPRLAASILDHVSTVVTTGRPAEMWRKRLVPADRAPGWYVVRFMPEVPDGHGPVEHVHVVASDVTELVENEQRLSAMALIDPLTGVSNRSAVFDRLQHALDRAGRRGSGVAVAVVDLDHFKAINDTFGHAAGDDALRTVAGALRGAVRVEDTVGRLGGDEFVVVIEDVSDHHMAESLGRRLHDALDGTTVRVGDDDHPYAVSASVGVAFTAADVPINDLVARADRAMYHAKRLGRGRSWAEAEVTAAEEVTSSSAMLRDLAAALPNDEFELHYQPIARAGDGRISAFEALLRWRHPQRGIVEPSHFLDALFTTGRIGPVGQWVLRTAVEQLAAWQRDAATEHLQLHVNVSPAELAFPGFAEILVETLESNSVDPGRLCIEITEQALAGSVVSAVALNEVASTGVRLVLDDFGTGVSSMSHLRARTLSGIKIDRSFVSGAQVDERERSIAESMIFLANALGIEATAEGVENDEQADWLRRAGCHQLQGWRIGRPEPIALATDRVLRGG